MVQLSKAHLRIAAMSWMKLINLAFFTLVGICTSAGCGSAEKDDTIAPPIYTAVGPVQNQKGDQRPNSASPRPLVMEADLGILRPNQTVRAAFNVRNETSHVWSLKGVEATCGCTVPSVSSHAIEPGKSATVDIALTLGTKVANIRTYVTLTFAESSAPQVKLVLKASVRHVMTALPGDAISETIAYGAQVDRVLSVQNHGMHPWQSVEVRSPFHWLKADATLASETPSGQSVGPLQYWRLSLHVDAKDLVPDRYSGVLHLSGVGDNEASLSLPIAINVLRPVRASPGDLFFGKVRSTEAVRRSIRFYFAPGMMPETTDLVSIENDRPDLKIQWMETCKAYWELAVEFKPGAGGRNLDNTIAVRFHDARLGRVELPARAVVE